MAFYTDFALAVFNGQNSGASFLGFQPVQNASMTYNQFGGIGPAKYTINEQYSATSNFLAPNRVDAYRIWSTLSASASNNATSIQVVDAARFTTGLSILVWDGTNYTFTTVASGGSGSVVNLSSPLTSGFGSGTCVFGLVHRGVISTVLRNPNLQAQQTVECVSYFQQLANFVPATASSDGRECGWFLYQLLSTYANSLNLNVHAANFAQTTDPNGFPNGTATNMGYVANNTNTLMQSVIQDVLNVANGSSINTNSANQQNTQWQFWIDLNNNVYFQNQNYTTVTKTYDCKSYTPANNYWYDLLDSHETHDNDTSNVINTYILAGGTQLSSGAYPVNVNIFDQNSVNIYGQIEAYLAVPTITDNATLTAWGTARLNATAYPLNTYTTTLSRTGRPPTCQDVIQVINLTDNTSDVLYSETFVPQTITLSWDVNTRDLFTSKISGGQLLPDINKQMKQIAAQQYTAVSGITAPGDSTADRFIQIGAVGTYTNTAFSLTAGTLIANLLVSGSPVQTSFALPSYTFTAGATSTVTVGYLYRNTNGQAYSSVNLIPNSQMTNGTGWTASTGTGLGFINGAGYQLEGAFTANQLSSTSWGCSITAPATNSTTYSYSFRYYTAVAGYAGAVYINDYTLGYGKQYASIGLTSTSVGWHYVSGTFTTASSGCVGLTWNFQGNTGTLAGTCYYCEPQLQVAAAPTSYVPSQIGMVAYSGLTPPSAAGYTAYQVVPLYVLTILNGTIIQANDVRNAGAISVNNMTPNPNPSTAPVLAAGYTAPLTVSAMAAASGAYDAKVTFGVTSVGTSATNWLDDIRYYAIPHGSTFAKGVGVKGAVEPNSTGVYTAVWDGLNAGTSYDLYITYLDMANNETPGLNIATTGTNPLSVGNTNQASGASGVTPGATGISAPSATGSGGSTDDVKITFTGDANSITSNPWIAELQCVATIHGTTNWQNWGSIAPQSSSSYTAIYAGMGAGTTYDLGLRYVDYQGNYSNVQTLYSSYTIPTLALGVTSLPVMPGGATFTVPASSISATVNAAGQASALAGAINPTVNISFKISESNTPPMSTWSAFLVPASRIHGTSTWAYGVPEADAGVGNNSTVSITVSVSPGDYYDIGVAVKDNQGNQTAVVTLETNYAVNQVGTSTAPPAGGTGGNPIKVIGPIISPMHLNGDTSGATTALSDGTQLVHTIMSSATKNVINSSSQILSTIFSGGTINSDGSISGLGSGAYANIKLPANSSSVISTEANVQRASSGDNSYLGLYDTSAGQNGYFLIHFGGSNQYFYLYRVSGGTQTALSSIGTYSAADTNPHDMKLSVTIQSGSCFIEGTVDGLYSITYTDSSPPSFSGIAVPYVLATGKIWNFDGTSGIVPYSVLHPYVRGIVGQTGLLNVNPTNGVTNTLPYANHATALTNLVDSSANIKNTSVMKTNLSNVIPVVSDWQIYTTTYSSGGYKYYVSFYIAGAGGSGTTPIFYNPDGTSFTAGTTINYTASNGSGFTNASGLGTSSSPYYYNTGATTPVTVYGIVYYQTSNNQWYITLQNGAPTASQVATAYKDGVDPLIANAGSVGQLGTTGSAGGTHTGGGRFGF